MSDIRITQNMDAMNGIREIKHEIPNNVDMRDVGDFESLLKVDDSKNKKPAKEISEETKSEKNDTFDSVMSLFSAVQRVKQEDEDDSGKNDKFHEDEDVENCKIEQNDDFAFSDLEDISCIEKQDDGVELFIHWPAVGVDCEQRSVFMYDTSADKTIIEDEAPSLISTQPISPEISEEEPLFKDIDMVKPQVVEKIETNKTEEKVEVVAKNDVPVVQPEKVLDTVQSQATFTLPEVNAASFISIKGKDLVDQISTYLNISSAIQEVKVQVKEAILPNTEFTITNKAGQMTIAFNTASETSFTLLSSNVYDLQVELKKQLANTQEVWISVRDTQYERFNDEDKQHHNNRNNQQQHNEYPA